MRKTPDTLAATGEPMPDYMRAAIDVAGTVEGTPFRCRIAFTGDGHAHVSAGTPYDGSAADPLDFRGHRFSMSAHLYDVPGRGPWGPPADGRTDLYLSRVGFDLRPVPPTAERWVRDTLLPFIGAWVATDPTARAAQRIARYERATVRAVEADRLHAETVALVETRAAEAAEARAELEAAAAATV